MNLLRLSYILRYWKIRYTLMNRYLIETSNLSRVLVGDKKNLPALSKGIGLCSSVVISSNLKFETHKLWFPTPLSLS